MFLENKSEREYVKGKENMHNIKRKPKQLVFFLFGLKY